MLRLKHSSLCNGSAVSNDGSWWPPVVVGGVEGKRQVDKVIDKCASMQVSVLRTASVSQASSLTPKGFEKTSQGQEPPS